MAISETSLHHNHITLTLILTLTLLGMCSIPVSERYRGIKSDSIIYCGLVKYRGIPSSGADF